MGVARNKMYLIQLSGEDIESIIFRSIDTALKANERRLEIIEKKKTSLDLNEKSTF